MSPTSHQQPLWLAIAALLVSMASYQGGAALAERLFPLVGAQGATAFRLGLGALVLLVLRRPWRRWRTGQSWRALWGYGLSMGAMNLVFYMALRTIPLGLAVALEFTGPLAIALFGSRRLLDVAWVVLVVIALALLLPLHREEHARIRWAWPTPWRRASAGRCTSCSASAPVRPMVAMQSPRASRSARCSPYRSAWRTPAQPCSRRRCWHWDWAWRC